MIDNLAVLIILGVLIIVCTWFLVWAFAHMGAIQHIRTREWIKKFYPFKEKN